MARSESPGDQGTEGSPGISSPFLGGTVRRKCSQCCFCVHAGKERPPNGFTAITPSAALALNAFLPRFLQTPCLYRKCQGRWRSSEKHVFPPPVACRGPCCCCQPSAPGVRLGKESLLPGRPRSPLLPPTIPPGCHPASFQDRNRDPFPLGTHLGKLAGEFLM